MTRPGQPGRTMEPPAPLHLLRLDRSQVIGGIRFQAMSYVRFHDAGKTRVHSGTLGGHQQVRGVWLKDDTEVALFPDGRLGQGTLERSHTVQGLTLAAGTTLALHQGGGLRQGILARAATRHGLPLGAGSPVLFHASGVLESGTPSKSVVIDGVPVKAGHAVQFTPEGRLLGATLSRKLQRRGVVLASGTEVTLHRGRPGDPETPIHRGILAHGQTISKLILPTRTLVTLGLEGRLERCTLAGRHSLQGIALPATTEVVFSPDGRILALHLPGAATIGGLHVQGGTRTMHAPGGGEQRFAVPVYLHPTGRINQAELASDQRVQGFWLASGSRVTFHPEGQLASGILAREASHGGLRIEPKTQISLSPGGALELPAGTYTLARGREVFGVRLHPGARVFMDSAGRVHGFLLESDRRLFGLRLPEGTSLHFTSESGIVNVSHATRSITAGQLTLRAASGLTLDRSGRLLAGILERTTRLGAFTFAAGSRIALYGSGAPMSGTLQGEHTCQGVVFKGGELTQLYESPSRIKEGVAARDQRKGDLSIRGDTKVAFHPNGQLRMASLAPGGPYARVTFFADGSVESTLFARPHTHGQVTYPPGVNLYYDQERRTPKLLIIPRPATIGGLPLTGTAYLYPSGRVRKASLSTEHTVAGVTFRPGDIHLHANGKVRAGWVARPQRLKGIPLAQGSLVSFWENGKLREARTAEPVTLQGRQAPAGATLFFAPDGRLVSVR